MTDVPDIKAVKTAHAELFEEIMAHRPKDKNSRAEFIKRADRLINEIELCSSQAKTVDDYEWLSAAAVQWQTVFSSLLDIPKNITLAPPVQTVQFAERTTPADDEEVERWINEIAYYFSKIRRAQALWQGAQAFWHDIGDLLREADHIGSDNEWKIAEDWQRATSYFASEVIEGTVNFVHQLKPDSYYRLESIWLKDVKELKAYFIWKQTRRNADENYYDACEKIRDRLLYCSKGTIDDFEQVQTYIRNHYLTSGMVNPEVNSTVQNLIRVKAKRIWETSGGTRAKELNWESAEMYVKMFYENIIPAVTEKNEDKTASVLKAFSYSKAPENRYLIINCFEAAVAIYFLDTQVVQKMLDNKTIAWNMIL